MTLNLFFGILNLQNKRTTLRQLHTGFKYKGESIMQPIENMTYNDNMEEYEFIQFNSEVVEYLEDNIDVTVLDVRLSKEELTIKYLGSTTIQEALQDLDDEFGNLLLAILDEDTKCKATFSTQNLEPILNFLMGTDITYYTFGDTAILYEA